jgi:5S rRNA maturation endonuclease (ribonuclease M5)
MKVRSAQEAERNAKKLANLLCLIRENIVFVEGQKDRSALGQLGCTRVMTISGNLRNTCKKIEGKADKVIVLTDIDRRGNELAGNAASELERYSISADIESRKEIAGILKLRFFEDAYRKYNEFMEENER